MQKGFTETRLENVDVTKTQPCKYFVYMDRGNPKLSKPTVKNELHKQQYKTVTLSDCNHLAHVIVLWQIQKFMLLYRYCFVTLYLRAISNFRRGDLTEGFLLLRYEFGGLIHEGAYFRNFTVFGRSSFFLYYTSSITAQNYVRN